MSYRRHNRSTSFLLKSNGCFLIYLSSGCTRLVGTFIQNKPQYRTYTVHGMVNYHWDYIFFYDEAYLYDFHFSHNVVYIMRVKLFVI